MIERFNGGTVKFGNAELPVVSAEFEIENDVKFSAIQKISDSISFEVKDVRLFTQRYYYF